MEHQHPADIAFRICEQRQIHPAAVLGFMLQSMATFHQAIGFRGESKLTVFDDISGMMQTSEITEPPASMLAAIDMFLDAQHSMDSHNCENHKRQNAPSEHLELAVKAEEAARLILKEIMNQGEHTGIASALALEERRKKQKPKDQGEADDDPKTT